MHGSAMKILSGESNLYHEFVLPDFSHIFDVIGTWYKTLVAAALILVAALICGYLLFWTLGLRLISGTLRIIFHIVGKSTKLFCTLSLKLCKAIHTRKQPEKLL